MSTESKKTSLDVDAHIRRDGFTIHVESTLNQDKPKTGIDFGGWAGVLALLSAAISVSIVLLTALYWAQELSRPDLLGAIFTRISPDLALCIFGALLLMVFIPAGLVVASRVITERSLKDKPEIKYPLLYHRSFLLAIAVLFIFAASYFLYSHPAYTVLAQCAVYYIYAIEYVVVRKRISNWEDLALILWCGTLLPLAALTAEVFLLNNAPQLNIIIPPALFYGALMAVVAIILIFGFTISVDLRFYTLLISLVVYFIFILAALATHRLENAIIYKYGGKPSSFEYYIYQAGQNPELLSCEPRKTTTFNYGGVVYFSGDCGEVGTNDKALKTRGIMFYVGTRNSEVYTGLMRNKLQVAYPVCRYSGQGKPRLSSLICAIPRPFVIG